MLFCWILISTKIKVWIFTFWSPICCTVRLLKSAIFAADIKFPIWISPTWKWHHTSRNTRQRELNSKFCIATHTFRICFSFSLVPLINVCQMSTFTRCQDILFSIFPSQRFKNVEFYENLNLIFNYFSSPVFLNKSIQHGRWRSKMFMHFDSSQFEQIALRL